MDQFSGILKKQNWIFLAFLIALCNESVLARKYYVSLSGSDTNTGLSVNQTFQSVTYALAKAAHGDSVSINDGVYDCRKFIYLLKVVDNDGRIIV